MGGNKIKVYGIGNPLIDILAKVTEKQLDSLGIYKGAMHLIDSEKREQLLQLIPDLEHSLFCGGSCPNTIITLASLGVSSALAGKVGGDKYGLIYKKRLKDLLVIDQLVVTDKEATGSSIILITPDSERTMNTFLGANRLFGKEDIVASTLKEASYFYFTGYMWDTESQKSAIKEALKVSKENNIKVAIDIADPLAVGRNREDFLFLIKNYADIVLANSEEARILFNNYDPYECCKSMGKLCETAIVKNGKRGSFISHKNRIVEIGIHGPQKALDTTGAGDAYAAGFLYGVCNNLSIEQSGFVASYLAGEVVQQQGAQLSKEKAQTISKYLRELYNLN
ncbi:MAG: adenosine kinase [Sphaerochaetaceae bacterium]|nr:adenosine kinase [Candidatus Cloacimonadota bacterium]